MYDEDDADNQVEFLRRENRRLTNLTIKYKNVKEEQIDSIYQAAFDAFATLDLSPVKPPKSSRPSGEELIASPALSDFQLGKITDSYDSDVCRERIDLFADKVVEINSLLRSSHSITKAHVHILGDIVEGERIFPGQCVDEETEALTREGWKRFKQIRDDEEIAIFDPESEALRWEVPERWNSFDYNGKMVKIKSKGVDQLVPPNHRCYTASARGNPFRVVLAEDLKFVERSTGFVVKTAPGDNWQGTFYVPPVWPSEKCPGTWMENVDPNDIASFVGWYVSEGWSAYGSVAISQSQQANYDKWFEIKSLLERIVERIPGQADKKLKLHETKDGFEISSVPLSKWCLEHFGHLAEGKRLPAWVKNWPKEQLRNLMESLLLGDGNMNGKSCHYTTTSDRLADDVQEVALKLGYSSWITPRVTSYSRIKSWEGWGSRRTVLILPHRSDRYSSRKEDEDYQGKVWCPTVSTGLWFMRRNSCVAVTGNSFEIHTSLYRQIIDGVEIVVDFLRRMLSVYDSVHVAAVIGNHGWLGRKGEYNPESNMDRLLYKFVSLLMESEPRITFDTPDGHRKKSFYTVDKMGKYKTLLIHGDQLPQPTSTHGYQRKILAWKDGGIPETFHDVRMGHYHQSAKFRVGGTTVRITGTPESHNTFAQEVLGVMGTPAQHLMFVDPSRGTVFSEHDVTLL